jgi:hypothetical protein
MPNGPAKDEMGMHISEGLGSCIGACHAAHTHTHAVFWFARHTTKKMTFQAHTWAA